MLALHANPSPPAQGAQLSHQQHHSAFDALLHFQVQQQIQQQLATLQNISGAHITYNPQKCGASQC